MDSSETGSVRVGIRDRLRAGLTVRRPRGSNDWVLVLFLEEAWLDAAHTQRARRGDCVIYAPQTPTYIGGAASGDDRAVGMLFNSYAHLAPELVRESLERYGWLRPDAPIGVPLPCHDPNEIEALLLRLQREWLEHRFYWQDALKLTCAELFLLLARAAQEGSAVPRSQTQKHEARLREVRLAVYSKPEAYWTVSKMAQAARLKESRFSALYSALFGTPPMTDVLLARIEHAKHLLRNYDLPVSEVAQECGFTNPYHFSRYFKQVVGCAPSSYKER